MLLRFNRLAPSRCASGSLRFESGRIPQTSPTQPISVGHRSTSTQESKDMSPYGGNFATVQLQEKKQETSAKDHERDPH
jgi:hypothetical protein